MVAFWLRNCHFGQLRSTVTTTIICRRRCCIAAIQELRDGGDTKTENMLFVLMNFNDLQQIFCVYEQFVYVVNGPELWSRSLKMYSVDVELLFRSFCAWSSRSDVKAVTVLAPDGSSQGAKLEATSEGTFLVLQQTQYFLCGFVSILRFFFSFSFLNNAFCRVQNFICTKVL